MLRKADNSAVFAIAAALVLFFIGGTLTTVVPPLVERAGVVRSRITIPAKGPTGKLRH